MTARIIEGYRAEHERTVNEDGHRSVVRTFAERERIDVLTGESTFEVWTPTTGWMPAMEVCAR